MACTTRRKRFQEQQGAGKQAGLLLALRIALRWVLHLRQLCYCDLYADMKASSQLLCSWMLCSGMVSQHSPCSMFPYALST